MSLQDWKRNRLGTMPREYRYAMVNRPVGVGTAPIGVKRVDARPDSGSDHHDYARHGIAVYDRKLTDAETKQFEMAPIADADDQLVIAKAIANDLREYAAGYIEMAKEDRREFNETVAQRLQLSSVGYAPSVGDIGAFASLVLKRLQSSTESTE